MTRPAKDPSHHGRGKHARAGGCDTGRYPYRSKQECETATGDVAQRCDRCRQWHAKGDRPQSRRGRR
jgi:hypothetical protein